MSEIPYLTPITGTSSRHQEGLGPLFLLSLDLLVGFWQKLSTTTDRHIYLQTKVFQS